MFVLLLTTVFQLHPHDYFLVFFQPLHAADTRGVALLPRERHNPPRRETSLRAASQSGELRPCQARRLRRGHPARGRAGGRRTPG